MFDQKRAEAAAGGELHVRGRRPGMLRPDPGWGPGAGPGAAFFTRRERSLWRFLLRPPPKKNIMEPKEPKEPKAEPKHQRCFGGKNKLNIIVVFLLVVL